MHLIWRWKYLIYKCKVNNLVGLFNDEKSGQRRKQTNAIQAVRDIDRFDVALISYCYVFTQALSVNSYIANVCFFEQSRNSRRIQLKIVVWVILSFSIKNICSARLANGTLTVNTYESQ